MILNFVTFANHFNGSIVPTIDLSTVQSQLAVKIEGIIKQLQNRYIEKVLSHGIATNNFYQQLTLTIPQNCTLTQWITIEPELREMLVYFLYTDIMQLLKTNESGLGANMGLSNFDKSFLVTYYNSAVDIAIKIRNIVFKDSSYGTLTCPCELSELRHYPF